MKRFSWIGTGVLAVGLACSGCGRQNETAEQKTEAAMPDVQVLLSEEPADAQQVIAARESAEDDAPVTIIGRIGGSENPWIEDRAAFSIVDGSLQACSDIPGDQCRTPWDYCCATDKLPKATALIKVVDDQQNVIKFDARKLLGVKELQTVVVTGKARRDDAGNLTVLADGIYIKSPEAAHVH